MQSKSLVLLFIVLITAPIIMLSSNHELFFWVASLIITVLSFGSIYKVVSGEELQNNDTDEDIEEELEELMGLDIKRFGTGLSVVYNMFIILFLCYCAFFMEAFLMKAVVSFAILIQVYFIIHKAGKNKPDYNPDEHKPKVLLSSVLNIAIIFITVINKLYKLG